MWRKVETESLIFSQTSFLVFQIIRPIQYSSDGSTFYSSISSNKQVSFTVLNINRQVAAAISKYPDIISDKCDTRTLT